MMDDYMAQLFAALAPDKEKIRVQREIVLAQMPPSARKPAPGAKPEYLRKKKRRIGN
jgi:hypothetical protein